MPEPGIAVLQAVAALLAGYALFRLWRAFAARGVGVAVIAIGFALRALGGAAAFLVSWLELPVARSLQFEKGLWFFAIDARRYARIADRWIHGGVSDVLLPDQSVASYLYVQLVALCRSLFGAVHSSAILINLFAYLGAAFVIVALAGSGDARRKRIATVALAAMAFMPSWVLWSLQPLKDALFVFAVLLFLFGSDRWLSLWREAELRGTALLGAAAICLVALHALGGIRWYYACLAWMVWLPTTAWAGLALGERKAKFWIASLLLFGLLAQALVLNLPVSLADGNRMLVDVPSWLSSEVRESRVRFVTEYNPSTSIKAGPLLEGVPNGEIAARAAMVVLPRFVTAPLGLAHAGGGRGLWLFAEADTIAFSALLLFAIVVVWRSRSRRLALDGTFALALILLAGALPVLWAVNNFGTLVRFREMFTVLLLAIPVIAARHVGTDAFTLMVAREPVDASASDRAGVEYWSERWTAGDLPGAIDPRDASRWNYVNRRLHAYFQSLFGEKGGRGSRLLEIGCGNSVWLPYFRREHGFTIDGLDYSPEGCDGERRILEREKIEGAIHCANLFSPPPELEGAFDAVVSFGVVEHFDDTDSAVRAATAFLRPGGVVFTLVPNMNGLPGLIQKIVNRRVYDAHVPLTPARLGEAHARAGLTMIESRYFLAVNFGINSIFGLDPSRLSTRLSAGVLYLLNQLATLVWKFEELAGVELPAGRLLSPYVVTAARRSNSAERESTASGTT